MPLFRDGKTLTNCTKAVIYIFIFKVINIFTNVNLILVLIFYYTLFISFFFKSFICIRVSPLTCAILCFMNILLFMLLLNKGWSYLMYLMWTKISTLNELVISAYKHPTVCMSVLFSNIFIYASIFFNVVQSNYKWMIVKSQHVFLMKSVKRHVSCWGERFKCIIKIECS